ncbi:hypothetical protein CLPU_2c02010 [Gottschalkia purinilytica]|uniref:Uncharacterized protein n=1 Tax=Gottschalkia purinilytica TaxID=1503 RepID=A0A0L0WE55_GOTPU|nr:hypothetical protein [Gottschalkia purinilytica]KNF09749.1 hypothetical protein CLPU_2c02010 [Gottschalkia purinilytica]
MVVDTNLAFAVTCSSCGRLNVQNLSFFDLYNNKRYMVNCSCGDTNAIIKARDTKSIWLEINCIDCQEVHIFKYSLRYIIKKGIISRCTDTGMEICFMGNSDIVNKNISNYENNTIDIINEIDLKEYFTNYDIMIRCLEKVKWLKDNNRITCDCGKQDITIEIFSDRIEVKCTNCQSIKVVYAENEEDYSNVSDKCMITMHQHRFECIDAIKNNDKNK